MECAACLLLCPLTAEHNGQVIVLHEHCARASTHFLLPHQREPLFLYRPSPVKLPPPQKNRYFAPTDNFKAGGDNFKGVAGTTFALPSSHQNGHPPTVREIFPPFCRTRYCPPLTFSPRGDNFAGEGRYRKKPKKPQTTSKYRGEGGTKGEGKRN